MSSYNYSITTDTLNGKYSDKLEQEIHDSNIVTALNNITESGDTLTITFEATLSSGDETTLTAIVNAHDGEKLDPTAVEIDDDGRQVTRTAATYKGWRYLAHVLEMETATLNGVFSSDWQGTSRSDFTIKYYDNTDTELVAGTQAELDANCVKTVVTIKPSYDYDIVGGNVHQHTTPTENVRMWVVAGATELGALGVREFVGGLNMKFMGINEQIETDGRASARMNHTTTGVPFQTNQLQYIITHPVGYQHELMIVVEYFRA